MASNDLAARYRRWLLELWHGDVALASELVSDDFVVHQGRAGPGRSEDQRGPAAVVAMVEQGHAPFDDLRFDLDVGPLVDGDFVVGRWTARGRYAGGLPGATAPPGTAVTFSGTDVLRAADGRFVEYWVSSDGLALMAQLGALGGDGPPQD